MFQTVVPHHNTGSFRSHRVRLPDKEYGEALDCLVKGCSDLLLTSPDGARVLLGKRKVQPQPVPPLPLDTQPVSRVGQCASPQAANCGRTVCQDWWFVGGRIFPGETPAQSCSRLLKRELALEIDPSRFETVCCQSLAWGMREQPPKDHGTTDLQVVLTLQ